ncbi:hypothetical protein Y032_0057g2781 [Ancylostoma ceylanicum]|uniref:Uncharacterized protein n=1 Tax=Ancylostoma ceylanicum TaxID=53326 RepID=A0A016U6D4_9BILA|nr:hypothetical protein Y032_0057g2781 [Ancylostoma ceylanicum]
MFNRSIQPDTSKQFARFTHKPTFCLSSKFMRNIAGCLPGLPKGDHGERREALQGPSPVKTVFCIGKHGFCMDMKNRGFCMDLHEIWRRMGSAWVCMGNCKESKILCSFLKRIMSKQRVRDNF